MKGPGGRMDPRIKGLVTPVGVGKGGGGGGGGGEGRGGGVTGRYMGRGGTFFRKSKYFSIKNDRNEITTTLPRLQFNIYRQPRVDTDTGQF